MKLLSSFLHINKEPHVDFLRNTYCFPVARAEGQGSDFIPLPLKGGRPGCAHTDHSSAPNHTICAVRAGLALFSFPPRQLLLAPNRRPCISLPKRLSSTPTLSR